MKLTLKITLLSAILILGNAFAENKAPTAAAPTPQPDVKTLKQAPTVTEVKVGEIVFPKGGFKGKILQLIRVKSYQYIEFQDNKTKRNLWVAASLDNTRAGNQIEIKDGTVMSDFYGQEVNMHFDYIIFTEKIKRSTSKK